ncbi:class I SAM-dependent methyltransferase [Streptomyces sp. NBC_01435]|uniref:class I SAM-dependent methyltransferase n=1 Tax=Streptomyces sp. NBC_01435 TaxID=2903865 RepID=UPI002E34B6A0|nr:class I SAM-dependent methyltransferase [Streptomyces sp. NBC_01435]
MSAISREGDPSPKSKSYFDGGAALYDRSRPRYPDALIARIADAVPGGDILDVGCGSGIEARQFQAAGCTVLGVDPDEQMAEYARTTGVPVEAGKFETWEAAGRTFDAVVAGTAWHWVDPRAGAAAAAQVLRPGGLLAPFHHSSLTPPELADAAGSAIPAWTTRSADAYQRVGPQTPFDVDGRRKSPMGLYQPLFDEMAEGIRETGCFSEPEQWRFDWERTYTRDEWLGLLPTQGALAKLPQDELAEILDAAGVAIDKMGGSFSLPYATVAVTAVRLDVR